MINQNERDTLPRQDPPQTLIVDDEPAILTLASAILQEAGHEVTTCTQNIMARNLLSKQTFDLILLDIHLPGESGIALCQELRNPDSDIFAPSTWVIAFTSDTREATVLEILHAGANDYLNKSNDLAALKIKATVARFAQRRMWALKKRNALLEQELERMATKQNK